MNKCFVVLLMTVVSVRALAVNEVVHQAILERNLLAIEQALATSDINEADSILLHPLDIAVVAAESALKCDARAHKEQQKALFAFEQVSAELKVSEDVTPELQEAKSQLRLAEAAQINAERNKSASYEIVLWFLRNGADPFAAYVQNPHIAEENYHMLSFHRRVRLVQILSGVEEEIPNEHVDGFLRNFLADLIHVPTAATAAAAAAAPTPAGQVEPWNDHAQLVEYLRAARRADQTPAAPVPAPPSLTPPRRGLLNRLSRAVTASSFGFSGK